MALITPSGGGGGGTSPTTHEELSGLGVTIADGAADRLTWDSSGGPDTLLDLTNPAIPTIITAGIYAVQVSVRAAASMTLDGFFQVQLQLDKDGFNASAFTDSRLVTAIAPDGATPEACVTFPWYLPAGARVEVWVTNQDSAATRGFLLNVAHVQRLA